MSCRKPCGFLMQALREVGDRIRNEQRLWEKIVRGIRHRGAAGTPYAWHASIPAFAGMTSGAAGSDRRGHGDSRFRGDDRKSLRHTPVAEIRVHGEMKRLPLLFSFPSPTFYLLPTANLSQQTQTAVRGERLRKENPQSPTDNRKSTTPTPQPTIANHQSTTPNL